MRYLEGVMAETGRVINRRYLLQRLIKQGTICAVYQGTDQVLQRNVAVKVAPAEYIAAYRAAIRGTSQFSHPNIVGIYDLVIEPETLYIVQEYVDGDDFSALLQMQLTPYQVTDLGVQLCQALIYAGSASRKICHGDLTPSSVMRNRQGLVRLNNFALPSDLAYFTSWSSLGGEGAALSDQGLPWGQQSEGRRQDDTRAVGLLLYQLLAGGQVAGATSVEPPTDGRLRFQRNVPAELCDVVARAVVRQHPQHIQTAETLMAELRLLAETLEPPIVSSTVAPQAEDIPPLKQFSPAGTGKMVSSLPVRETSQGGTGLSAFRSEASARMPSVEPAAPTIADMSPMSPAMMSPHPPQLPPQPEVVPQRRRLSLTAMILIGLVVFALFFVIGFVLEQAIIR